MVDFNKLKRAKRTVEAYKAVFGGDDGRVVLIDLMKKCHFGTAVTERDPVLSAFNDGKRCAVLDILKMVGFDEGKLIELYKQREENNG